MESVEIEVVGFRGAKGDGLLEEPRGSGLARVEKRGPRTVWGLGLRALTWFRLYVMEYWLHATGIEGFGS